MSYLVTCIFAYIYMIGLTVGDREENITVTSGEKNKEIAIAQNLYTFKNPPELFLLSLSMMVNGPK